MAARVGLIVNPIAGMGGRVGLKGTDGEDVLRRAHELGADPVAPARAARALARLERCRGELSIVAGARAMGTDVARSHGFETEALAGAAPGATSAVDTRWAASEMERRGVELILFAGGDGTGRDILDATGGRVPVLGIPTGVKMHSGVFATSPEAAADILAAGLAAGRTLELREAEVLDAEPDGEARSPRLYGVLPVPKDRRMQNSKAGSRAADADLDALCRVLAHEARAGGLTILGPGTTTGRILAHLGLEGTLRGVDAVEGGRLAGSDLNEAQLLALLDGRPARLVIGVVGGQGFVFGRGNQQLSTAVIRRIGYDNLVLVSSLEKVALLDPAILRVDTGDPELDRDLEGYRAVRVAPKRSVLMRVSR